MNLQILLFPMDLNDILELNKTTIIKMVSSISTYYTKYNSVIFMYRRVSKLPEKW